MTYYFRQDSVVCIRWTLYYPMRPVVNESEMMQVSDQILTIQYTFMDTETIFMN